MSDPTNADADAEAPGVAHGLHAAGAGDQRLGGHAAAVEALAAHAIRLDQRHGEAEPAEPAGNGQPGRAGPDHHRVMRPAHPRRTHARRHHARPSHSLPPGQGTRRQRRLDGGVIALRWKGPR